MGLGEDRVGKRWLRRKFNNLRLNIKGRRGKEKE
jgi:hypothetical protein